MRIEITRQACCAADDQLNPLDMSVEIASNASLNELVKHIRESGFLQYSSTHSSIMGRVASANVVRMYSNRDPEYFVDPAALVSTVINGGRLDFRF